MDLFRWDDTEQDDEQFVNSVEFSEAIDYVIAQHIQGECSTEKAEKTRAELSHIYHDDAPMKLHVGNAFVDGSNVPFRVMARNPLEAKFAAKQNFGDVPVSVRNPEERWRGAPDSD